MVFGASLAAWRHLAAVLVAPEALARMELLHCCMGPFGFDSDL